MIKKDFLLEIGVEEIPASYIAGAMNTIEKYFIELLSDEKLTYEKVELFSTPRRFAIRITEIQAKQADETIERVGPTKEIAYDADGNLTKAALGFLRGAGATENDIFFKATKKGEKLAVKIEIPGKDTFEIMKNKIPDLFNKFNFPKTMRWGDENESFARPLRWIVALWDRAIIPIKIGKITSANTSYGNRFQKLENPTEILTPQNYEYSLQNVAVIVNRDVRKNKIIKQMEKLFSKSDESIVTDEKLLDIVTDLVEFPTAVIGYFSDKYLELPQKIITSTLSQHQKYFAVQKQNGELSNKFVFISNGNPEHSDLIRLGNEKVIAARLDDASFFYKEDTSQPFEKYVGELDKVLFQAKLGSLLCKTDRIIKIAEYISEKLELSQNETSKILRAANLCKADLVTQMLGEKEFTKLQGYMGMNYALVSGEDEEVARAIYEHYQPRGQNDDLPQSVIGAVIAIADKLDTVCGIMGVDMIPSGSNDPFALRRAANGVVQIIAANNFKLDIFALIDRAFDLLANKLESENHNKKEVYKFFLQRIKWLLQNENIDHDVIDSVMHIEFTDIADLKQRAIDLQQFKEAEDFIKLVIGFKRVTNIISKAKKEFTFQEKLLKEQAELDLYTAYKDLVPQITEKLAKKAYSEVMDLLVKFGKTIDNFFDNVMVNTKDEELKNNRYALLQLIQKLFYQVSDLSKIVVQ